MTLVHSCLNSFYRLTFLYPPHGSQPWLSDAPGKPFCLSGAYSLPVESVGFGSISLCLPLKTKGEKTILNKNYFRRTAELKIGRQPLLVFPFPKSGGFDESDSSRMFKTSCFLSTFFNCFYWKKKCRVSYSLIILFPSPNFSQTFSTHPSHSLSLFKEQNPRNTRTQMPTKTQVKTSKQKINRQQMPKQCIKRQTAHKILLSVLCRPSVPAHGPPILKSGECTQWDRFGENGFFLFQKISIAHGFLAKGGSPCPLAPSRLGPHRLEPVQICACCQSLWEPLLWLLLSRSLL